MLHGRYRNLFTDTIYTEYTRFSCDHVTGAASITTREELAANNGLGRTVAAAEAAGMLRTKTEAAIDVTLDL